MKRVPVVVALALLGLLSFSGFNLQAAPTTAPTAVTMDFVPASLNIAVGQTKTIELRARGATDLAGYEVNITYNSTRISVTQVERLVNTAPRTWGSLPSSSSPTFLQLSPGVIAFGAYSYGSGNPAGPNGDVVLARLSVKGLATGSATLAIANPIISNSTAQSSTPTVTNAAITIGAPAPHIKTTGVVRPSNGLVYLKNQNSGGFADTTFVYGIPNDKPVAGDWDGDGKDTVGIYRNGSFYLKNTNTNGPADIVFSFGTTGDVPVAGDWNGDGIVTVGVYRNGMFFLRDTNSSGAPDVTFSLGMTGDLPIGGDWTAKGFDSTGVFRPSNGLVYLKNANTSGFADNAFVYGIAGDLPVAGDWNADAVDSIGIYRNANFYLRNNNNDGFADYVFPIGIGGDVPIVGDWDGLP